MHTITSDARPNDTRTSPETERKKGDVEVEHSEDRQLSHHFQLIFVYAVNTIRVRNVYQNNPLTNLFRTSHIDKKGSARVSGEQSRNV